MADNFGLKIGIEGEKEFKKALSEINQSFKVLGSEMKLVSSQFEANDKSIQALSARNTVLNKEIDAQRQKVETLRAALQNASESFGENDRRTQNWQIQLNNAEAALNGMERELSANERAIESLSQQETEAADATERLSQEISRQEEELAGMKRAYSNAVLEYGKGSSEAKELEGRISQLSGELRENRERMKDAGDVAEDFGDSLEDASSGADKLGSGLSVATVAMGNLISSGIQAALSGIQELGSAIWNLDEATEEYRVAQGKLTTAFEAAGYSGDAAQKSYTEFYKILGDTDTATEASQLLAQLAQNEQDITKWTNIAAGVYGTFGDALPIEGMIESANETAKVGEVTGSLADALNWVGISEDAFNEKLAACSSESERNRLIMETLSGAYDEASGAFYRNNEALVASREGQAQLDETLAGLGETISNVKNSLRAEFLPAISEVISAFTDMVNGVDGADEAFAGAITGLVNTAVSMLPQFQLVLKRRSLRKSREKCMVAFRCTALYTIPCAVLFLTTAQPMLHMLFSKGELNGLDSILKVLAITVIFYGLAFMLGSVLFAAELYYSIWIAVLVSVVVRLVSFSVMSSALKLDLYAGAYSDALSAFVLCLILLGMVRQQLKIAVSWLRVFLAPLLAGILMALVCLLCSQVILKNAASPVRMLVSAVVGLLVYFVSTVVLKGATRRELRCFAVGDVLIELASTMRLL